MSIIHLPKMLLSKKKVEKMEEYLGCDDILLDMKN
jgi:hypothetical protein